MNSLRQGLADKKHDRNIMTNKQITQEEMLWKIELQ